MPLDRESERNLRQLLDFPREDMTIEIKNWLDFTIEAVRAKFAKELIALANHGGGYVLFGFEDETAGYPPSGPCPYDLSKYSPDAFNDLVKRYAEPRFECYTYHLTSSAGNPHVVVEGSGRHTAPIRAQRSPDRSALIDDAYYIRRPGPESAPPRSGAEWDALIRRCLDNDHERQLDGFRRILAAMQTNPGLATAMVEATTTGDRLGRWVDDSMNRLKAQDDGEAWSRYDRGWWSCAYRVVPVDNPPTIQAFRTILMEVQGHETGWPPWLMLYNRPEMATYIEGDVIETWLHDTDIGDYWRADPTGLMFLLRRYQEDERDFQGVQPGEIFELTLPLWRTGECLLHAGRLADRLGAETIEVTMTWTGLRGRQLTNRTTHTYMLRGGRSTADAVSTTQRFRSADLADTLPEIVKQLVSPLYARFEFADPPDSLYVNEITRMRTGSV